MRVGEGGCGWSERHGEGDEASTGRLAMTSNKTEIKLGWAQRSHQLSEWIVID